MTVYRDAGHCIARIMSIEANSCTAQSAWQRRYQAGFPEIAADGSGLSPEERLAQDSMTYARVKLMLPAAQWHAVVAKYSISVADVARSVNWLAAYLGELPAHREFRQKAVAAWAVPNGYDKAFYDINTWDTDGTPERTLYRWRSQVNAELRKLVSQAHKSVQAVIEYKELAI